MPSANAGRRLSAQMQTLNDRLAPDLRRPLADVILQITGTSILAETATDAGSRALYASHEAATTLYGLEYHTDAALLALEGAWYAEDFRGQKGERPSVNQLIEFGAARRAPVRPAAQSSGKANGRGPGGPRLSSAQEAARLVMEEITREQSDSAAG